jgi:ADP-ribosylglycohydrolase
MVTRRARIEGGLVGLLVGDALGVPYEFHAATAIPPHDAIEMQPPAGFRRAHVGVPPGTWSDDGAQALCLLASLLHHDRLDVDDFARLLRNWYDVGYCAVDGEVFDVGVQTGRALAALRAGTAALDAGPRGEYDNGNGSLMRVLPLALWHRGDDGELVRDAMLSSRPTHGHLRAQLCCALYCLWARRLLDGGSDAGAWDDAAATLAALVDAEARDELLQQIKPSRAPGGGGSGYVVDSLHSARGVLGAGSYEGVVRAAIALGNDTDTTACIAGGIAGIRDGIDAIPPRWRGALRGGEILAPLVEALLAHG